MAEGSQTPWWSKHTVAVVTGGNKGVGFGIVRKLLEQGLTVVLTARDPTDALKADGLHSVFFHPLDVKRSESVRNLANWLKEKFGEIDILVNSAGVSNDIVTVEEVENVLETNYYGVKRVTEAFLPLLRASSNGARIVNLASRAGLYERLKSQSLKEKFRDEENYTVELADWFAAKYLEDVKAGQLREEGWIVGGKQKEPTYSESKMFLNVYSIALGKSLAKLQPPDHQIFVVSFCPGVTDTDMLRNSKKAGFIPPPNYPVNPPTVGADTGVWLALMPKEELAAKVGKLWAERTEYAFGWVIPA
jgi:carbonyl reductase 1